MLSRFFIPRPVFAAVIAILTFLAGAAAIPVLPVEQYPPIAPPTIQVMASYPGANAETVMDTVTAPIEEVLNGVEDMLYVSSSSSDDGNMTIVVTFRLGTDLDLAAVRVKNRVSVAEPKLPAAVRSQGVTVEKRSPSMLLIFALLSPGGTFSGLELSNFAILRVKDAVARVPGVGSVDSLGGSAFAMRVWLDRNALTARELTPLDVVNALREQNVEVAAGQVGQEPAAEETGFQYTLNATGRLQTVEEFEAVVLKATEGEQRVRLGDVARIELGAERYTVESRLNGQPSAALGVFQLPGSNALDVAEGVRAVLRDLAENFPEDLTYEVNYDATRFISASIDEVVTTLVIASLLVFLTVFLFLQDWRASVVPGIAIPVSIVGTAAFLYLMGLSLNLITLLALVLAIGIVVDDAIVVVEAISRKITDDGLSARDAAVAAMDEITGPVIATTAVLLAVFAPTLLFGGITGELYRQFGLTLSVATVLSSINALTLSPALSARLLRPSNPQSGFFRAFNRGLGRMTDGLVGLTKRAIATPGPALLLFLLLVGATGFAIARLPTGFLPPEDQSVFYVNVQLPDAAKLARTRRTLEEIRVDVASIPGVERTVTLAGTSFITDGTRPNVGTIVVVLDPWDERRAPELHAQAIADRVSGFLRARDDAEAFAFLPPAIRGLGRVGGFDLRVQDRVGVGLEQLQDVAQEVALAAGTNPRLEGVFSSFRARVPQYDIDVDRLRTKQLGVPLTDVFDTLGATFGSTYVNDINRFGRTYQVRVQADASSRKDVTSIPEFRVRNRDGEMVPLGSLIDITPTVGPPSINRYNLYPAASITGRGAAGVSSGEALQAMEQIASQALPGTMGFEWTGMAYEEKRAGDAATAAFVFAVVVVFLVLAAQYESWVTPFSVLLTVPFGLLGAAGTTALRALDLNLYTQIGFVLLLALAAKNAILIVEYAKSRREAGASPADAAVEALRLRFRPVLMTALSFVLGALPLVFASGAGADGRRSLGTAVVGGMLAASILGVVFIPVLDAMVHRRQRPAGGPTEDE